MLMVEVSSYLGLNEVALLKDLDNGVLLLGAAELGLKCALGGRVESALVTVADVLLALMFHCIVHRGIGAQKTLMAGRLTCG
jgi:hypothetical protein